MSNNHANDSFRSRLAAADCVASIVGCIRKMRAEGLEDNEIAGLFRHAADELDAASRDRVVEPRLGEVVDLQQLRQVAR